MWKIEVSHIPPPGCSVLCTCLWWNCVRDRVQKYLEQFLHSSTWYLKGETRTEYGFSPQNRHLSFMKNSDCYQFCKAYTFPEMILWAWRNYVGSGQEWKLEIWGQSGSTDRASALHVAVLGSIPKPHMVLDPWALQEWSQSAEVGVTLETTKQKDIKLKIFVTVFVLQTNLVKYFTADWFLRTSEALLLELEVFCLASIHH